jgi:hypothetical protein
MSDEEDDDAPLAGITQKKKKKKTAVNKLPPSTRLPQISNNEEAIAEWMRSHPCLYFRGHREYYKGVMKDCLIQDQVDHLNSQFPDEDPLTMDQLKAWMTYMRDRYTKTAKKLEERPSGAGAAKPLTGREKEIMDLFAFLQPYISHHKGTSLGVSIDIVNASFSMINMLFFRFIVLKSTCRIHISPFSCNVCMIIVTNMSVIISAATKHKVECIC